VGLISKDEFFNIENISWLYCGAESPSLKRGIIKIEDYFINRSKGPIGRDKSKNVSNNCKEKIAKLANSKPENIAFTSSTSESISLIINSLNLKKGDNIIITNTEHSAGVLPSLAQKEKGVHIKLILHKNWEIIIDDILEKTDDNTRAIIISHVSYMTGSRINYKRLYEYLQNKNILMILDATQSMGALPVDAQYTDFLVCSSYKWLLGHHGLGILVENPSSKTDINPDFIGWRSIREQFHDKRFNDYYLHKNTNRFELGYPSYTTIYNLNYSIEVLLNIGINNIKNHIISLGNVLIHNLKTLGLNIMSPEGKGNRSGNICVFCKNGKWVETKLAEKGIFIWGGDERIRISIHLFNNENDIDLITTELKSLIEFF